MTRILMVDDDRTPESTGERIPFETKGFNCDLFHNAFLKVLNHLKKQSYGLCILDVRMPLKTGFGGIKKNENEIASARDPIFISHRWDWKEREYRDWNWGWWLHYKTLQYAGTTSKGTDHIEKGRGHLP